MKKVFFSIALFFLFSTAFAQVTYYKGEWTKINSEANFSAFLKMEIKDSVVNGEIIWTFKAIDSADDVSVKYYNGQKEKMGIEYVKGIYSIKTSDIHFEGTAKTDPDLIIGMDKYLLKLSLDRSALYGRSLANGQNNGLVFFYKINNTIAEKEFKTLRSHIILRSANKAMR